jgi:hydrogenase/urease accessory protein HupE
VTARRLAAAVLLLWATPASAHTVLGIGGFTGGLLHPVLVLAHALSLVALGLLIGSRPGRTTAFVSFAVALACGLVALTFAVGETLAPLILLADAALIALIVACDWTPPTSMTVLLAAIAGGAIGLDSPPDAVTLEEGNLMLVGTWLGACTALALVAAAGCRLQRPWQVLGVRIAGSWIAASALLVLVQALR